MKKYIIKNCPAYLKYNKCLHNGHCDNITDCALKRIVNECGYASPDGGFNDSEAQDLASEILEQLDIEECENE